MKNKGIPFIEQHVEKIFLGVAGVAFLSIVAWQVLGTHNNVMLDGRSAAPGDLDEALAQKTQALAGKLEQPAPSIEDALKARLSPKAESYAKDLGSSVSPRGDIPQIEPVLASRLQSDGATSGRPFHVPEFPALAMRPSRVFSDTIDPAFLAEKLKDASASNAYAAFKSAQFGTAGEPYDVTWVVPSAVIDVDSIRSELSSKQGGDSIPEVWYGKRLFIVDVQFEREQLMANGSWGGATMLPILPGQASVRAEIETGMAASKAKPEERTGREASLRDSVMDQLAAPGFQSALLQPDFFPTKQVGEDRNFDPSEILKEPEPESIAVDEAKLAEERELVKLRQRRDSSAVELKRQKERLADLGGEAEEAPKEDKKNDRNRGSGGGAGAGGGGGGGGANRPGSGLGGAAGGMSGGRRSGNTDENLEQRVDLTKKVRALEKKLADHESALAKKLQELGRSEEKATLGNLSTDLSTAKSVVVWAHDLSAKPGQTYRYRAVAKVYNPFFTSGPLLVESQKRLADSFALETKSSPWCDPIRVGAPVEFFVTEAVAGEGKLGLGTASVEVYRFHDGDRRLETFSVQPGDRIGSVKDKVDYDTGFFVVDIFVDPAIERGASDRRPSPVVVVQNLQGDRYELRVPRYQSEDVTRLNYQSRVEVRSAEEKIDASDKKDAPKDGGKDGGRDGGNRPRG